MAGNPEEAKADTRSYYQMGSNTLNATGKWFSDRGDNVVRGAKYVGGGVADGWKYVGGEHAYAQTANAVYQVYQNRSYWVILCSVAFVGLFPLMYYLVAPMMPKVGGLSQMMMAVVLQTTVFAVVILAMLGTLGPSGLVAYPGKIFGY